MRVVCNDKDRRTLVEVAGGRVGARQESANNAEQRGAVQAHVPGPRLPSSQQSGAVKMKKFRYCCDQGPHDGRGVSAFNIIPVQRTGKAACARFVAIDRPVGIPTKIPQNLSSF